jgi:hypothetical protein
MTSYGIISKVLNLLDEKKIIEGSFYYDINTWPRLKRMIRIKKEGKEESKITR